MGSKVYFTDFRCPVGTSQIDKIKRLCKVAGINNIDFDGDRKSVGRERVC